MRGLGECLASVVVVDDNDQGWLSLFLDLITCTHPKHPFARHFHNCPSKFQDCGYLRKRQRIARGGHIAPSKFVAQCHCLLNVSALAFDEFRLFHPTTLHTHLP